MAYGDNRSEVAADTFDSSISGDWTNPGFGSAMAWLTGGHVEPGTAATVCTMVRVTETFADDQYSTVTVNQLDDLGYQRAIGRYQDTSNYYNVLFVADPAFGVGRYLIQENVAGTPTTLAQTGTAAAFAAGDTLTFECEGTALRAGSNESGAGDSEKLSTTDNSLTSGDTGLGAYDQNAPLVDSSITAWSGGDIVGGANPKGPLGLPLHGPFAGPVGP